MHMLLDLQDVSGGGVVSVDMVGGGSLICNFVRSEIHDNNATVGGVLRGVTWSDPYTASQISITVEDSEISNNNAMVALLLWTAPCMQQRHRLLLLTDSLDCCCRTCPMTELGRGILRSR
eukprot:scaffold955_cov325-Prasinococcus_capsulatus_cf.AAC.4